MVIVRMTTHAQRGFPSEKDAVAHGHVRSSHTFAGGYRLTRYACASLPVPHQFAYESSGGQAQTRFLSP